MAPGYTWQKNLATVLLLLLSLALAEPARAKEEWAFETLHTGSGAYRYSVTEDAIRIENKGNGGIAVATAPTWKISCYRPGDKLEFITDLKNFDRSLILAILPKHSTLVAAKPKSTSEVLLKGLPCNRLKMEDGSTYWIPKGIKGAAQIPEVIARYFNTANISGIPIRIEDPEVKLTEQEKKRKIERHKKTAVPWLNFSQMERDTSERVKVEFTGWKKVPYKASDFEYPKGYKRTNDLKDVIISTAYRNDLIDLAKDFASGSSNEQKQKKSGGK